MENGELRTKNYKKNPDSLMIVNDFAQLTINNLPFTIKKLWENQQTIYAKETR